MIYKKFIDVMQDYVVNRDRGEKKLVRYMILDKELYDIVYNNKMSKYKFVIEDKIWYVDEFDKLLKCSLCQLLGKERIAEYIEILYDFGSREGEINDWICEAHYNEITKGCPIDPED